MSTTTQPTTETRPLINYRSERRLRIELNDPPANTYTYEMIGSSTTAILRARMDERRARDFAARRGREVFLRGRQHSDAHQS